MGCEAVERDQDEQVVEQVHVDEAALEELLWGAASRAGGQLGTNLPKAHMQSTSRF